MPTTRDTEIPEPWRGFLAALDSLIGKPADLHCLGGFVVSLQYGLSRETSDIDVLAAHPTHQLAELQRLAGENSSLHGQAHLGRWLGTALAIDISSMADSQHEIALRGSSVDDAVVPDTKTVKPCELAGQRLARATFVGKRLLDLRQDSAR